MPSASGIIFLAGFGGGGDGSGDSPMGAGDPTAVGGITPGDSPMSGGSPTAQGGTPDGDAPMSGGSPTAQGGVPDGDAPMSGGSPTAQGGVPDGDSPMGNGNTLEALVGNVLGEPTDGSERPSQGGVGVRINGSSFSERDEVDLVTDMPGLELAGTDISAPPADRRAEARFRVAGEVELSRLVIDLLGAPGTTPVFAPSGLQARLLTTRILVAALDVTGAVTTQPELQLQQAAPGDVLAQVALSLTATGQCQELPANAVRQLVNNGQTLTLGHAVTAVATTYQVQLIFLGRVVPA